jgi:hypothetical protein
MLCLFEAGRRLTPLPHPFFGAGAATQELAAAVDLVLCPVQLLPVVQPAAADGPSGLVGSDDEELPPMLSDDDYDTFSDDTCSDADDSAVDAFVPAACIPHVELRVRRDPAGKATVRPSGKVAGGVTVLPPRASGRQKEHVRKLRHDAFKG